MQIYHFSRFLRPPNNDDLLHVFLLLCLTDVSVLSIIAVQQGRQCEEKQLGATHNRGHQVNAGSGKVVFYMIMNVYTLFVYMS